MVLKTIALVSALLIGTQDAPTDIAKSELPKEADCVICSANGESHGPEKAAAGVRYKGQFFYFCNAKEVAAFKGNPEAYLAPVLPRAAPKLTATTIDGKEVSLDNYKGKVVLIDFWATWCKPCVDAMPHLIKLQKEYGDKGFTVLGVSIDEETKKVGPFVAKRKLTYPVVIDSKTTPTWQAFNVSGVPAVFLIDRDGQIIAQWRGKMKPSEIEAAVKAAIAKPAS
jgi:cytochrome c biogenesis protein CcmG, thiol:disulfide interchange protein DsbE